MNLLQEMASLHTKILGTFMDQAMLLLPMGLAPLDYREPEMDF